MTNLPSLKIKNVGISSTLKSATNALFASESTFSMATLSPNSAFNLSIVGIKEIQSICAELKLDLIILLDPNISDEEADSVQKPFDEGLIPSYRLSSNYLKDMGLLIHYPALVFYKNGNIIGTFRPGYDEPKRIKEHLSRRLK